jgi:circadian clock protein KaiC
MGLQFLAEGARRGEKCLHYGCYEPPTTIVAKADRLGLDFSGLTKKGNLFIHWFRPAEVIIDALIIDMLEIIREKKIQRLFIDGFVGFRSTHPPDRVSAVFSALTARLISSGVTTLISDETRELFVREVEVPTANVSAIFHNIVFLRQVEVGAELQRLVSIMKTRDSAPDRRLWRYEIGDAGLELVGPFAAADHRLMIGGGGKVALTSRGRKPARAKPARRKGR